MSKSDFAEGWMWGARTALLLVLGMHADGGAPYDGPWPPELEAWVNRALERLNEQAPS